MAFFGTIELLKEQVDSKKFKVAFEYLEKVRDSQTIEHRRLLNLPIDAFEKVDLDHNNFALEQVYNSKERSKCFFESHKQYIDVQFILEGEEIIEVINTNNLMIKSSYNDKIDLVKYEMSDQSSILKLKKGDIAIFFPQDGHMPCIKIKSSLKVVKTVIKVHV